VRITEALYTYGIKDRKLNKILTKMKHGQKISNLYVVVLPLVQDGILEIYGYNQLLQPFYQNISDSISVVGVAKGREGALSIVQDMVQDMYDSAGDGENLFDAVHFFGFAG
jgi:hypothetical protein